MPGIQIKDLVARLQVRDLLPLLDWLDFLLEQKHRDLLLVHPEGEG